jgi:hypothetical protein
MWVTGAGADPAAAVPTPIIASWRLHPDACAAKDEPILAKNACVEKVHEKANKLTPVAVLWKYGMPCSGWMEEIIFGATCKP